MWVMAVVGDAPCQCFSPGSNQTTSPGRISSIGPPSRCAQPQPNVTISVWPSGMRVPRRARARLEGDGVAGRARRRAYREQRVDPHGAGEPVGRVPSPMAASRFA